MINLRLYFQIRVKVVQARQLMGGNLMPVVRVTVNGQMRQTRIKKSTSSPWWDESFFFNFHIPPAELVDELIDFAVMNSKTLRSDALIGSFKVKHWKNIFFSCYNDLNIR